MDQRASTALLLRLPAVMKDWLRAKAAANDRNMTAELKQIIRAAMAADTTQKETTQ